MARVRYPPWDLTLSVTAGQFLDGDQGVAVDLGRFFGTTEVGIFLRHSEHGSLGGLRLAVPLTLARELKPLRVRPRLPDVFTYEVRTTVFTDRNIVRSDIGGSCARITPSSACTGTGTGCTRFTSGSTWTP
ncbi:MAG: hypothetical protein KatS3mg131_0361 [Candidatus Tectimicrobiota bacterium]|nr:MAG: hypothetical protein KatS3mg131_0361 [Candidatus Tectomicrobia bacterium]